MPKPFYFLKIRKLGKNGVKLQGREAGYLPPSSSNVKNDEAVASLLHTPS
jgi:hypothetical protein